MAFEIEEISRTMKKNPKIWIAGVIIAAGAGIYVWMKKGQQTGNGYVTEAYPEQPVYPEGGGGGGGDSSGQDVASVLVPALIQEMQQEHAQELAQTSQMQQDFLQGLSDLLGRYVDRTQDKTPQSPVTMPEDVALLQKAEYVRSTPSIVFSQQGSRYAPEQVDVMYDWALKENVAISRGFAGTSESPVGLGESGMTMIFYPTGHVAFTPKGQQAPPRPTTYTNPALAEAARREQTGWTGQQVSKVTGKTGTVEQQLTGMTAEQKLATLRKAGLIQ